MSYYIDRSIDVLVPVQIVEVTFCEREETSLNAFQYFILEAINCGKKAEQIAEATLLTRTVIETEIEQLIRQKLLIHKDDSIGLTELSRKILLVSECVKKLNNEKKWLCINLMTGNLRAYEAEKIVEDHEILSLVLHPKISEKEIDGINLVENMSFFREYMTVFSEMNDSDIDRVLSSVYVKFKTINGNKKKYIKKVFSKIPCVIGKNIKQNQGQSLITAKGWLYRIRYEVDSDIVKSEQAVLKELITVEQHDRGLISSKGYAVLELYKQLMQYNKLPLTYLYDTVSGQFQFEQPEEVCDAKKEIHLELPQLEDLSDLKKRSMMNELRKRYHISSDFNLREVSVTKEYYSVTCELSELMEEDYV